MITANVETGLAFNLWVYLLFFFYLLQTLLFNEKAELTKTFSI
jgi:hypothetical protein